MYKIIQFLLNDYKLLCVYMINRFLICLYEEETYIVNMAVDERGGAQKRRKSLM